MSLIKSELTDKSVYTLEFSVDQETFNKAISNAYRKQVGKIAVPGFRKGKAPRSIIEKMYGKGVFYEDALNACIGPAYEEAAKESELSIVGRPEFDVVSIEDNAPVMKATVYVKPEVTVENYLGIEV